MKKFHYDVLINNLCQKLKHRFEQLKNFKRRFVPFTEFVNEFKELFFDKEDAGFRFIVSYGLTYLLLPIVLFTTTDENEINIKLLILSLTSIFCFNVYEVVNWIKKIIKKYYY